MVFTHRLLRSSFLELPYRIQNMNHKKELIRGLYSLCICHRHVQETSMS